jgi:hypothetical protein
LPRRPVRVTTPKPVYGTAIRLKVTVPDRGLIRTSGAGVQRSYVAAQKAKAYLVPVRLSKRAIATLRHVRRVRVPVSVRFTPSQGKPSTARVSVTFRMKAMQQNSSRSARRATVPSPLSVKGR